MCESKNGRTVAHIRIILFSDSLSDLCIQGSQTKFTFNYQLRVCLTTLNHKDDKGKLTFESRVDSFVSEGEIFKLITDFCIESEQFAVHHRWRLSIF